MPPRVPAALPHVTFGNDRADSAGSSLPHLSPKGEQAKTKTLMQRSSVWIRCQAFGFSLELCSKCIKRGMKYGVVEAAVRSLILTASFRASWQLLMGQLQGRN